MAVLPNILLRKLTKTVHQFSNNLKSDISTAGIIVIGDEILKGHIQDTNSKYLAEEIRKMGVQVKKISVIGDVVHEVAEEVKAFSTKFHHVITTGGIGPTHDDITYEAVGLAFGQSLVLNETLKQICQKFYETTDVTAPGMKMAYIPQQAKLLFKNNCIEEPMLYPNVSVNNVYMFPGIPELLTKSFSCVKGAYFKSSDQFFMKCLYLKVPESQIIGILNKVVKENPDVQVGSYPKLSNKQYKVKLTIESVCEKHTTAAYKKLTALLPQEYIINEEDIKEK